jgi:hypothetical protein
MRYLHMGESFLVFAAIMGVALLDMIRQKAWPDFADPWVWVKTAFLVFVFLWTMRIDAKRRSVKAR